MLSKDFTRLVVLAFILGAPIGYILLNRWLEDFAYHISIGWGTFALTGIAVLLTSWITVSYQSLRAALANPVNSLQQD